MCAARPPKTSTQPNHPRLLIGVAAGVGSCLTPIFIAEVSPARIRGKVGQWNPLSSNSSPSSYSVAGVFTQISVVVGIMITQLIGFGLATPTAWRYVLLLSGLAAVGQFLISPAMVESPVWVIRNGDPQSGKIYHQKLWKDGGSHCKQPRPWSELALTTILQLQMRTRCLLKTPTMGGNMPSASPTLSRQRN